MPNTPELNGLAERMNRIIMERVRSMLAHAKLPKMLSWKFSSIGGNTSKESKTGVCIVAHAHAHALFVKY